MYDIVAVGGASAGLTAALYASRQGMKTLVLTKDIGGQAILTPHIENYPGFETVAGPELMQRLQQQAASFGAEFRYEEVKEISRLDNLFRLRTPLADYDALALILAFGKTPRDLGVPGEEKLVGRGISYCAVCDAPLFRGKDVAVVGWGDPALDAVLMLCPIVSKVYVIFRGADLIGHDQLLDACRTQPKIEMIPNSTVVGVLGANRVEGISIRDTSGQTRVIPLDGVFVEIGYKAKTDFVRSLVKLNEAGEIVVDKNQATSEPGIFAAGDVTDTPFKQVIISAGEGAKAGLAAYNYVQTLRGRPAVKSDWRTKLES
jgi:thioredoxin reductase (NADPH)